MNKIIYNSKDYTDLLIHIAKDLKTKYENKYPYNLGYHHENDVWSWDCFNLIKSIIWGWNENEPVGYYAKPDTGTGMLDYNGSQIMQQCSYISTDFHSVPLGAYILYSDNDHAGTFIGNASYNGCVVNVVECTAAWGGGVKFSYVDTQGRRFDKYGGKQNGTWKKWGMLPWIDYGTTGLKYFQAYTKGTAVKDPQVLRVQYLLNGLAKAKLTPDSYYGPATTAAVRTYQKNNGLTVSGNMDPETWNKLLAL